MMLHHRGNFVLAPREYGYIIAEIVTAQEHYVLVAERGERGEATAQAGGKQQCCGVVAKVSACSESVEQADEQTAGDVYGKRVIGERSRHVVLHKL